MTEPENGFFGSNKIENYEEILTGAHRNPPPRARPPFLTSHIAFWNPIRFQSVEEVLEDEKCNTPKRQKLEKDELARLKRHRRKLAIDRYLIQIINKVGGVAAMEPNHTPNLDQANSRLLLLAGHLNSKGKWCRYRDGESLGELQIVTLCFNWNNLAATIRVEQRTEYSTLTCFLDLSGIVPESVKNDLRSGKAFKQSNAVRSLEDLERRSRTDSDASDPLGYVPIFDDLYLKIWNDFYNDVLEPPSKIFRNRLGKIFADFRGVVLAAPASNKPGFGFQPPFWRPKDGDVSTDLDKYPEHPPIPADAQAGGHDVIRRFWNLFVVPKKEVDFRKNEIIATPMLGGRAIYVSSLGAQPIIRSKSRRFPLFYFIYCYVYDGWQIGRLVNHLHYLGCERLAALVSFTQLRSAGYSLRAIEDEIRDARLSAEALEANDEEDRRYLSELSEKVRKKIGEIDIKLNKLNQKFDGDIGYRIERSQYYISQFREGIKVLRRGRIDGYQRYDDFIERRVGPAFGYISSLLTHFGRVENNRAELFQYYLSLQSRSVQQSTNRTNSEIEWIQIIADVALWGALMPYYLGSVLFEHVLPLREIHYGSLTKDNPLEQPMWLLLIGACWIIGFLQNRLGKAVRNGRAIRIYSFCISIAIVFSCLTYLEWNVCTKDEPDCKIPHFFLGDVFGSLTSLDHARFLTHQHKAPNPSK